VFCALFDFDRVSALVKFKALLCFSSTAQVLIYKSYWEPLLKSDSASNEVLKRLIRDVKTFPELDNVVE